MLSFLQRRPLNVSGPEDVARRRALAQSVMARNAQAQPKNLWEGLNSLATSIGERNSVDRLDAAEAEGRASGKAAYQPIVDALKGGKSVDNATLVGAMSNDWLSEPERDVLGSYFKQNLESAAPLTKWQQAQLAKDDQITPYQREYLDYLKSKGGAGDQPEYGLQPQYGYDENGKIVILQVGRDGKAVKTQMPEGGTLSKAPIKIDAGTHYELVDPVTRQVVGRTEKNLAGAEAEKVIGKGQGEAAVDYGSLSSKMPGIEAVVRQLDDLAKSATYTTGGQLYDAVRKETGFEPREAAIARTKYISIVDNQILPLLRDTFGAQFTQKEGESLKVTLGDPKKTPAEKQAVLKSFIEQKRRDVEALAAKAGDAVPGGTGQKRLKFNKDTGELE